ncbi:MAG: hypothetical protein ACM33U_13085 [Solirubrobacterales bacterium]
MSATSAHGEADVATRIGLGGLLAVSDEVWEIPATTRPYMRVPARVFADRELLDGIRGDRSLEQLQNVATLPGIVEAAMAIPDVVAVFPDDMRPVLAG